jgi:hypothetical protein
MLSPMSWLATAAGVMIIGVALRDLFHSVFRPAGQGVLSNGVMRVGWWLLTRRGRTRASGLAFAGPVLVMAVLGSWTAMLLVGWALLYWPRLGALHPAEGVSAPAGLWTALYLSAVTLTTLGLGDLVPLSAATRALMPAEALVGLALFTVTLSWILELYPVIASKRALARHISLIHELEQRHGCPLWSLSPEVSESELTGINAKLVAVAGELLQMPASYYFEPRDARQSVAAQLEPLLSCLNHARSAEAPPATRIRAELVQAALGDLAHALRVRFLPRCPDQLEAILRAYRLEHIAERPAGPKSDVA